MRIRLGPWILGLSLLVLGAGSSGGDILPDFVWRNTFDPVHGAFNRQQAAPVRLALRMEGRADRIPISWKVLHQEQVVAEGDTVAIPARNTAEVALDLRLPPLPPGRYLLETTVDPEGVIEEQNERNNTIRFAFVIPDGSPVRFRCEGPEGSIWEIYRVELSTATGAPYPDEFGTAIDTSRSDAYELVVNGVEPNDYVGVLFGPTVNRTPVLASYGSFTMPDPAREVEVVWPRTTPYLVGRPRLKGQAAVAVGGETGAPRWQPHARWTLEGTIRNPTGEVADVQWLLRFLDRDGYSATEKDTTLYLGANATEGLLLTGRIPEMPGNFLMQAEVRVPWPPGFEDLGEDFRAASFVLPLGWIEVER